ncbi:MAG TPA: hypothetical protein VFU15_01610 [Bacteroidia bacterium]|nr:hypothetical protein [Bacteroidia bacterium]
MLKKVLPFVFTLLLIASCRYDHVPDIAAVPPGCDTLHPSYHNCVVPILKANCYSCHSDSASNHGQSTFDMEDFTLFKNELNLSYQGDTTYGSKFMAIIGQRPLIIHMPPTGKLPQQDINTIQRWVTARAPEN